MKQIILVSLVCLSVVLSAIVPFNNDAIEKIFQQKKPALFLFTKSDQTSTSAKAALKELDQAGSPQGVILTLSDSQDGFGLFDRLTQYLGVDSSLTPQVLFLGAKAEKYRFDQEAITKDTLLSFIIRVQSGQVEQFLKSAPIPETNDQPVKIIVGKSFKELVLDSQKQVLVKFYAPWCGHCKNLAPHYDQAAKKLQNNPNILIAKVDSTQNQVAGLQIQGFPTLKFWGKDKSVAPIDYTGDRTADGIITWLKQHTEYQWVQPAVVQTQTKQEQKPTQGDL